MTKTQTAPDDLEKSLKLVGLALLENVPFKRQIWLMSKAGFQPAEIAQLLDTTPNSINVRLSEMRKAKRKARTKEG